VLPSLANVWIFNRGSALATAAGSPVTAWPCSAETGRSWIQSAVELNPVAHGSGVSKSVWFNPVSSAQNKVLVSNTTWSPGTTLHVFFVIEIPLEAIPQGTCLMRNSSTSTGTAHVFGIKNNAHINAPDNRFMYNKHQGSTQWAAAPVDVELNELMLLEFQVVGNNITVIQNGSSASKTLSATNSTSALQWRLGASGDTGGASIEARVREHLMCTSIQANAADIRAYFAQLHGVVMA
jgi:hypothetical protein